MGWIQRMLERGRLERELDKELAYHLERRRAELTNQGIDPREAARRVRLEFGGADEVKEACRDARGTRWVEDFIQDCRYALRTLRNKPVFALVAVTSLALGIGVNTAVFSLLNTLVLTKLPIRDPDNLYQLIATRRTYSRNGFSVTDYDKIRSQIDSKRTGNPS